ncbi:DHA2 family efflux MFS transporter permease subunit [Nocardia barduliensis]|uniref:DHA2 family efflux MFS transporter permease subunit n=1 Tax=Nocardia barduliensis TaxID=2736643 RepID=UPI001FEAC8A2|nr:DHA2 family efflux MFS transporter permease subunit [Nocardia barduliensis]
MSIPVALDGSYSGVTRAGIRLGAQVAGRVASGGSAPSGKEEEGALMDSPVIRWLGLAALCFAELLVFVDNTIVNVALPTIATDLGAGTSGLQMVVDVYTLVFAGFLLTGGYLGDRFGRKTILIVGIVGFAALSALAATSNDLGQLIAARAGLGLFAALVFPATLAIAVIMFDDLRERAIAVACWAAVAGAAAAIGPVIGGWLLHHYSWGSIFWINVPAGAIALIGAAVLLPQSRNPEVGPFDFGGTVLSVIGISVFVYSVIEAPNHGWLSFRTVTGLVIGSVVIGAYVVWENRFSSPLFDVRLFRDRTFATAAMMLTFGMFALMGFVFLMTQYFQGVREYLPFETGVRTLPFAIALAVFGWPSMWLGSKIGALRVAAIGSLVMAAAFWLTIRYDMYTSYWGVIAPVMVILALGVALVSGPATFAVLNELSTGQVGAGSAVNDTSRELGGTLGVAVLGSVLASVYSEKMTDGLDAIQLPEQARAAATNSMLSGVHAARVVPGPGGVQLVDLAKSAFLDGFHMASVVAGGVAAGGAIAGWLLRPAHSPAADNGKADDTSGTGGFRAKTPPV